MIPTAEGGRIRPSNSDMGGADFGMKDPGSGWDDGGGFGGDSGGVAATELAGGRRGGVLAQRVHDSQVLRLHADHAAAGTIDVGDEKTEMDTIRAGPTR